MGSENGGNAPWASYLQMLENKSSASHMLTIPYHTGRMGCSVVVGELYLGLIHVSCVCLISLLFKEYNVGIIRNVFVPHLFWWLHQSKMSYTSMWKLYRIGAMTIEI